MQNDAPWKHLEVMVQLADAAEAAKQRALPRGRSRGA
jgi:hypothetical protein